MVNEFIEKVSRTADGNKEQNINDYRKDGLLYCGKCNTPKEAFIKDLGIKTVLCKCQREERELKEQREKQAQLRAKAEESIKKYIPKRYQDYSFSTDDGKNPKQTKIAKNYIEDFDKHKKDGKGLLFNGDCGVGKTYLGVCIIKEMIYKGYNCIISNVSDITQKYKYDLEEYINDLMQFDLVMIDDLGVQRNTDSATESLYCVIDKLYKEKKPIIATSNLTNKELLQCEEMRNKRIYERIKEMCLPVNIKGENRRNTALKEMLINEKEN